MICQVTTPLTSLVQMLHIINRMLHILDRRHTASDDIVDDHCDGNMLYRISGKVGARQLVVSNAFCKGSTTDTGCMSGSNARRTPATRASSSTSTCTRIVPLPTTAKG